MLADARQLLERRRVTLDFVKRRPVRKTRYDVVDITLDLVVDPLNLISIDKTSHDCKAILIELQLGVPQWFRRHGFVPAAG